MRMMLEAANLIATVRRGREKLHFLNPVPLKEIYERWIAKFEKPRLKALSEPKKRLRKPGVHIEMDVHNMYILIHEKRTDYRR
jgi:hypothetical protein